MKNMKIKRLLSLDTFPLFMNKNIIFFMEKLKDHPKFGMQFHATHFRKDIPQTKQGVISYLSSELFKGIGKKTAEKIVETLGNNAITKILNQPSLLDSCPKTTF